SVMGGEPVPCRLGRRIGEGVRKGGVMPAPAPGQKVVVNCILDQLVPELDQRLLGAPPASGDCASPRTTLRDGCDIRLEAAQDAQLQGLVDAGADGRGQRVEST